MYTFLVGRILLREEVVPMIREVCDQAGAEIDWPTLLAPEELAASAEYRDFISDIRSRGIPHKMLATPTEWHKAVGAPYEASSRLEGNTWLLQCCFKDYGMTLARFLAILPVIAWAWTVYSIDYSKGIRIHHSSVSEGFNEGHS